MNVVFARFLGVSIILTGLGGCQGIADTIWMQVSHEPGSLEAPFPTERERYYPSDLAQFGSPDQLLTSDPMALAQALLAVEESESEVPRAGVNIMMVEPVGDSLRVVTFTQTGLMDDSVRAHRYRLEFVPEGDQWRLDWVGQQFSCHAGRGRWSWHADLCS